MLETVATLIPFGEGVGEGDPVSIVFPQCPSANGLLTSCPLCKVPLAPRLGTIPIPRLAWDVGDSRGDDG